MEEWPTLLQTAFSALYRPESIEAWLSDSGLQRAELSTLVCAYLCPPPLTFDMLADWMPYNAPELLRTRLGVLLNKGFIQAVNGQEYRLTDKGLELVQSWTERERVRLAGLTPLPPRDLHRLSTLLSRIVQAALAAPPPPGKDRLLSSRRIAPSANAAPMVQIDQYLTDLVYFRDDAHVSAWRRHNFDGPAIEVLTLLWRGEATDVDGLSAALTEQRGYTRDDYAPIVERLQERGLVDASQPTLAVTPQGSALRKEIEATTDRYHMFPWTVLSPVDVQELRSLLLRFAQALSGS